MSHFLQKLFVFTLPAFFLIGLYIFFDPFKIIYSYDNYYKGDDFVSLNRSVINGKNFINKYEKENYNAFIFGSSRTLAVKTNDWVKYLPKDARPYHYDGNAESLFGINSKLKFVDSKVDSIKYVLIFVDQMLLGDVSKKEGLLYLDYPIVNNESWIDFHKEFLYAFFAPRFFVSYFIFKFTGEYKSYMGSKILNHKYPNIWDPTTSDLFLGLDEEIKNDSLDFYSKRMHLLDLKNKIQNTTLAVSEKEIELLKEIKAILVKHKTQYKIISNPFISQFQLCEEQKNLLNEIFGVENVYDFSGPGIYSNELYNFYDASHFRPQVARDILQQIYNN